MNSQTPESAPSKATEISNVETAENARDAAAGALGVFLQSNSNQDSRWSQEYMDLSDAAAKTQAELMVRLTMDEPGRIMIHESFITASLRGSDEKNPRMNLPHAMSTAEIIMQDAARLLAAEVGTLREENASLRRTAALVEINHSQIKKTSVVEPSNSTQ